MKNRIKIVNPNALEQVEKLRSEKKQDFFELNSSDFELCQFEIEPDKGYALHANPETKEIFPYCCNWHTAVYETTKKWFDSFPECCEYHRPLGDQSWFNKDEYENIPAKVVYQLSFTEQCILNNSRESDWYDAITDYIEWNIMSFGRLPQGFGTPVGLEYYLGNLEIWIKNSEVEIPSEKKEKLLQYINREQKPYPAQAAIQDLNELRSTYKKWLSIFPFNLGYFKNLKPHFEKQLPILTGKPKVNRFSGLAKARVHTQESLIQVLVNTTKNLLSQVDITSLRKEGSISDIQATQLEFYDATLKSKTAGITKQFSTGELKYLKALQKWLLYHKEYFEGIGPIIGTVPPNQIVTNSNLLAEYLRSYGFFELEKISSLTSTSQKMLVDLLIENGLPYSIAMFDFLGFLHYLGTNRFPSQYKMVKEISRWYNSDKDGRSIKGHINSLNPHSKDRPRFTAYLHIKTVEKDYHSLK